MASTSMAKLGRELIAYTLSPPVDAPSSSSAPSHASIVSLSHPTPSAPVSSLRGVTPSPSSLSLTSSPFRPSCLAVHSDAKKAQIYVHEPRVSGSSSSMTTTTTLSHHFHPPEPTPQVAVSPTGAYLAAGSTTGRLYLWNLASGNLVCALDAHFRQVTCLSFSSDGLSLISASADARILVYSLASLVAPSTSSESENRSPYAVFADHTQSITALSCSSSTTSNGGASAAESFPSSTRILSASEDGSVKLWDIRSRRLVKTWTFSGSRGRPITHLALESGARSFFVVLGDAGQGDNAIDEEEEEEEGGAGAPKEQGRGDAVKRVDMYAASNQPGGDSSDQTVVKGPNLYRTGDKSIRITSLALSTASTHLLIGTSRATLLMLDVASQNVIRSLSLLPQGAGLGSAASRNNSLQLCVSNLVPFIAFETPVQPVWSGWNVCSRLARQVTSAYNDEVISMRLAQSDDVNSIAMDLCPPSLAADSNSLSLAPMTTTANANSSDSNAAAAMSEVEKLQRENEELKRLVKRAHAANEAMWSKVVQGAVKGVTTSASTSSS